MPGDVTLAVSGVETTPLDYPIPGAAELLVKILAASYNGADAAGPFVPAQQLDDTRRHCFFEDMIVEPVQDALCLAARQHGSVRRVRAEANETRGI